MKKILILFSSVALFSCSTKTYVVTSSQKFDGGFYMCLLKKNVDSKKRIIVLMKDPNNCLEVGNTVELVKKNNRLIPVCK